MSVKRITTPITLFLFGIALLYISMSMLIYKNLHYYRPTSIEVRGQFLLDKELEQNDTHRNNGDESVAGTGHRVSCDSWRERTMPIENTIAIGCAVTTKHSLSADPESSRLATFSQSFQQLPFFSILLPSFCRTLSSGFHYSFYVAYDHDDPYLADTRVVEIFQKIFDTYSKTNCAKNRTIVELQMVLCNYSGRVAWAQNDALMAAYRDNFAYYYMLNDDTKILSQHWTEALVNNLAQRKWPNFGVTGPRHFGDDRCVMTHNFVHKTHIDLFSFFYPRLFKTWHADEWIMRLYNPWYTKESLDAVVRHATAVRRYNVSFVSGRGFLKSVVSSKYFLVQKILTCCPEYSTAVPLL